MPNGQQVGCENFNAFMAWKISKSDHDFKQLERRGILNRTEIHKECGFSRSVLTSNPDIKAALEALEDELRERKILPPKAEKDELFGVGAPTRQPGTNKALVDAERLKRLEQENAALRNELCEVKRQLQKYTTLQQALSLTGRLPR